jgi:Fe2+ or Zn2+ uptake regulation protein
MKEFSPGLLNIESCEENSVTCTKCNAKFPHGFYCLKCGHVPPREAKVEDSQGELKQAA